MPSDMRSALPDRLTLHRLAQGGDKSALAEDARAGLTSRPKTLPPKYFYDELGSRLFEAICALPEYYLTRAESEILSSYADDIVSSIGGSTGAPARLVELGSGSAEKTRFLIEALLRRQPALHYLPVDISAASLERSSVELLQLYPRLRVTAYAADYFTALRELVPARAGERTAALFLGSNIGNFAQREAADFLLAVRKVLKAEDSLLLGADLKKSADILIPAYDDALGVTAAFNRNLLVRINRELGADFCVEKFRHLALYDEERGRVEAHLVSTARQTVRLAALDLEIGFDEGETIHTENSYKFDLEQLRELARATGFHLERSWLDGARRFSFNLFAVA